MHIDDDLLPRINRRSPGEPGSDPPDSGMPWFAIGLCIAVCLVGLLDRDLWTPDEPSAASSSLEMSRTGGWAVPHLHGQPRPGTPPLYYAAAAWAIRLFGPIVGNTGAIRLTSALWSIGALFATFFLARRLSGPSVGLTAAILLATMTGFVENSHWIRADSALLFFVTAAVWMLAEVYLAGRRWHCVPAGAFAAGAFLSRDILGLAFVVIAWLGMVVPWSSRRLRERAGSNFFVLPHLSGLAMFILLAGAWLLALRLHAWEWHWHEWFRQNDLTSLAAGNELKRWLKPDRPWYYLRTIALYSLPWAPGILLWFGSLPDALVGRREIPPARIFLLVWIVGSTIVLSMFAEKRNAFLLPMLPALAIACAEAFEGGIRGWCRPLFALWIFFCLAVLLALTLSPLPALLVPHGLLGPALPFLQSISLRQIAAGLALVLALRVVLRRDETNEIIQVAAITCFLYIALASVAGKAMDLEIGMRRQISDFAARVPFSERPRTAGVGLSGPVRACFHYYCGWTVPLIDDKQRPKDIVAGKDPEFSSLIISRRSGGPASISEITGPEALVVFRAVPGRAGEMFLVRGIGGNKPGEPDST